MSKHRFLMWSVGRGLTAIIAWLTIVGVSTSIQAQSSKNLAGCWIRENDLYQGWVVEIIDTGDREFEAKSLWVPDYPRELNSFQIGEKKMRRMKIRNDGVYLAESLSRDSEGTPSYSEMELSFSTADRFVMLDDLPTGEIGDKQIWRRLKPNEIGMAYADYGRGVIASERERFAEAVGAYQRAAKQILQEKELKSHSALANGLAWRLATTRNDELRDPKLALQLVPALANWYQHADTAAAVHAANGDFDTATKMQEEALRDIRAESAASVYLRNNGLNENNFMLQFRAAFVIGGMEDDFARRLDSYRSKQAYRE